VRDVLYVADLVRLYKMAAEKIERASGEVFNVGGGVENTLAIWTQFRPILEKLFKREIPATFADWRPGDQKIFVSDISKVKKILGWQPTVGVEEGITKLYQWVQDNKELFTKFVQ
jgi:CDP-paratose 2-epimerase